MSHPAHSENNLPSIPQPTLSASKGLQHSATKAPNIQQISGASLTGKLYRAQFPLSTPIKPKSLATNANPTVFTNITTPLCPAQQSNITIGTTGSFSTNLLQKSPTLLQKPHKNQQKMGIEPFLDGIDALQDEIDGFLEIEELQQQHNVEKVTEGQKNSGFLGGDCILPENRDKIVKSSFNDDDMDINRIHTSIIPKLTTFKSKNTKIETVNKSENIFQNTRKSPSLSDQQTNILHHFNERQYDQYMDLSAIKMDKNCGNAMELIEDDVFPLDLGDSSPICLQQDSIDTFARYYQSNTIIDDDIPEYDVMNPFLNNNGPYEDNLDQKDDFISTTRISIEHHRNTTEMLKNHEHQVGLITNNGTFQSNEFHISDIDTILAEIFKKYQISPQLHNGINSLQNENIVKCFGNESISAEQRKTLGQKRTTTLSYNNITIPQSSTEIHKTMNISSIYQQTKHNSIIKSINPLNFITPPIISTSASLYMPIYPQEPQQHCPNYYRKNDIFNNNTLDIRSISQHLGFFTSLQLYYNNMKIDGDKLKMTKIGLSSHELAHFEINFNDIRMLSLHTNLEITHNGDICSIYDKNHLKNVQSEQYLCFSAESDKNTSKYHFMNDNNNCYIHQIITSLDLQLKSIFLADIHVLLPDTYRYTCNSLRNCYYNNIKKGELIQNLWKKRTNDGISVHLLTNPSISPHFYNFQPKILDKIDTFASLKNQNDLENFRTTPDFAHYPHVSVNFAVICLDFYSLRDEIFENLSKCVQTSKESQNSVQYGEICQTFDNNSEKELMSFDDTPLYPQYLPYDDLITPCHSNVLTNESIIQVFNQIHLETVKIDDICSINQYHNSFIEMNISHDFLLLYTRNSLQVIHFPTKMLESLLFYKDVELSFIFKNIFLNKIGPIINVLYNGEYVDKNDQNIDDNPSFKEIDGIENDKYHPHYDGSKTTFLNFKLPHFVDSLDLITSLPSVFPVGQSLFDGITSKFSNNGELALNYFVTDGISRNTIYITDKPQDYNKNLPTLPATSYDIRDPDPQNIQFLPLPINISYDWANIGYMNDTWLTEMTVAKLRTISQTVTKIASISIEFDEFLSKSYVNLMYVTNMTKLVPLYRNKTKNDENIDIIDEYQSNIVKNIMNDNIRDNSCKKLKKHQDNTAKELSYCYNNFFSFLKNQTFLRLLRQNLYSRAFTLLTNQVLPIDITQASSNHPPQQQSANNNQNDLTMIENSNFTPVVGLKGTTSGVTLQFSLSITQNDLFCYDKTIVDGHHISPNQMNIFQSLGITSLPTKKFQNNKLLFITDLPQLKTTLQLSNKTKHHIVKNTEYTEDPITSYELSSLPLVKLLITIPLDINNSDIDRNISYDAFLPSQQYLSYLTNQSTFNLSAISIITVLFNDIGVSHYFFSHPDKMSANNYEKPNMKNGPIGEIFAHLHPSIHKNVFKTSIISQLLSEVMTNDRNMFDNMVFIRVKRHLLDASITLFSDNYEKSYGNVQLYDNVIQNGEVPSFSSYIPRNSMETTEIHSVGKLPPKLTEITEICPFSDIQTSLHNDLSTLLLHHTASHMAPYMSLNIPIHVRYACFPQINQETSEKVTINDNIQKSPKIVNFNIFDVFFNAQSEYQHAMYKRDITLYFSQFHKHYQISLSNDTELYQFEGYSLELLPITDTTGKKWVKNSETDKNDSKTLKKNDTYENYQHSRNNDAKLQILHNHSMTLLHFLEVKTDSTENYRYVGTNNEHMNPHPYRTLGKIAPLFNKVDKNVKNSSKYGQSPQEICHNSLSFTTTAHNIKTLLSKHALNFPTLYNTLPQSAQLTTIPLALLRTKCERNMCSNLEYKDASLPRFLAISPTKNTTLSKIDVNTGICGENQYNNHNYDYSDISRTPSSIMLPRLLIELSSLCFKNWIILSSLQLILLIPSAKTVSIPKLLLSDGSFANFSHIVDEKDEITLQKTKNESGRKYCEITDASVYIDQPADFMDKSPVRAIFDTILFQSMKKYLDPIILPLNHHDLHDGDTPKIKDLYSIITRYQTSLLTNATMLPSVSLYNSHAFYNIIADFHHFPHYYCYHDLPKLKPNDIFSTYIAPFTELSPVFHTTEQFIRLNTLSIKRCIRSNTPKISSFPNYCAQSTGIHRKYINFIHKINNNSSKAINYSGYLMLITTIRMVVEDSFIFDLFPSLEHEKNNKGKTRNTCVNLPQIMNTLAQILQKNELKCSFSLPSTETMSNSPQYPQ